MKYREFVLLLFWGIAVCLGIGNMYGQKAQADDFRLRVTPPVRTISAGESTHYQVTVQFMGNYDTAVELAVSGLPGGVTGNFSVNPITQTGDGRTKLEIDSLSTAPAGRYTLTITGRGGNIEHSYTVILIIDEGTGPGPGPGPVFSGTIAKSFSKDSVLPGDELLMTLRLQVNTNSELTGVSIQDKLSPLLVYLDDNAPVRLRRHGQKLVWLFPQLRGGESLSFDVRLKVVETAGAGVVENTAYIYHDSLPRPMASNTAQFKIDRVDISFSKTVDKTAARPGDNLRYQIILNNRSSMALTGSQVVDDIPGHLEIISARTKGSGKYNLDVQGQHLSWSGVLAAGKEEVFTIETRVKNTVMSGTEIANIAHLNVHQPGKSMDSNPVVTLVSSEPVPVSGVTMEKRCEVPQSQVGRLVRFRIRVENRSSSPLLSPLLEDHLPQGLSYVAGSALVNNSPGSEPRGTRRLQWSLPVIGPGESLDLRYQVVIAADAKRGKNINRAILRALDNSGQTITLEASAFINISTDSLVFYSGVEGIVFLDRDGDKNYSLADTPLPGIEVRLSTGEKAVTGVSGQYQFQQLFPGEYAIGVNRATLPEKYRLVDLVPRAVVLADGLSDRVDFALQFAGEDNVGTARLQGRVFFDKNSDGKFDEGDVFLKEFQVTLTSQEAPGALTTRGRNGNFLLTNREPGSYHLEIRYKDRTLEKEIILKKGNNQVDIPLEFRSIEIKIRGTK